MYCSTDHDAEQCSIYEFDVRILYCLGCTVFCQTVCYLISCIAVHWLCFVQAFERCLSYEHVTSLVCDLLCDVCVDVKCMYVGLFVCLM